MSADTLVPGASNPQNFNRFAYAANNPVLYRDPTGHWIDKGPNDGGNWRDDSPGLVNKPDHSRRPMPKPRKPALPNQGNGRKTNPFIVGTPSFAAPEKPTQTGSFIGPQVNLSTYGTPSFGVSPTQSPTASTAGVSSHANTGSGHVFGGGDYLTVSLTTPFGGGALIWDKTGNFYISAGPGLGPGGAINIFRGEIDRSFGAPGGLVEQLTGNAYDPSVTPQEYLTGVSMGGGGGLILGGQFVWSSTSGFGGEIGATLGAYTGIGVQVPVFMITRSGTPILLPTCDRSSCASVLQ